MRTTEHRRGTDYDHLLPLFRRLKHPSTTAADRRRLRQSVLTGHLPLAEHIALRYRDRGQPLDDLRQVAVLGLIGAIDRFDPDRGDFIAFAVPTIMGEVRKYFRDHTWVMTVPRRLKELNRKIATTVRELERETGSAPRPGEIAARLGLPIEDIYEGLRAGMAYQAESLDVPAPRDERSAQAQFGESDTRYEGVENREVLREALGRLPEREAAIVRMRFVDELTQGQIAARIGISQVHVSRLLARSLAALRTSFAEEAVVEPAGRPSLRG